MGIAIAAANDQRVHTMESDRAAADDRADWPEGWAGRCTGILRQIVGEHGKLARMIEQARASDEHSMLRQERFPEIRREWISHAWAEEQHLYSALRAHPATRLQLPRGIADHAQIECMIETLRGATGSEWNRQFDELARAIDRHMVGEETRLFPRASAVLVDDQSEELRGRYLRARDECRKALD